MLQGGDNLLKFYIGLIVVDFLLGCAKGVKTKNLSSAVALWDFVNKVIALTVIVLCVLLDNVLCRSNKDSASNSPRLSARLSETTS